MHPEHPETVVGDQEYDKYMYVMAILAENIGIDLMATVGVLAFCFVDIKYILS